VDNPKERVLVSVSIYEFPAYLWPVFFDDRSPVALANAPIIVVVHISLLFVLREHSHENERGQVMQFGNLIPGFHGYGKLAKYAKFAKFAKFTQAWIGNPET